MSRSLESHSDAPSLSLCMIVKNEESFLEGCLESIKGIVDEIVIVDTGSTDSSRTIAEKYGARIFDFVWINDFAAARNYSLGKCTGDWILYLDADERLKTGHGAQLRKLVRDKGTGAYNVIIENPHSLHQGNFNQENSYPRLFRRLPGVEFEGKVHEQLWPSLIRSKVTIKQSSLVIEHLGYGQGYDVVRKKAERNLELLRAQLIDSPDDAYAQFQIGNTLVVLQRYDEAGPELERAINNPKLDKTNRASCFNLLAEIEVKRGDLASAISWCRKSLELAPKQLMAHWFLSLLHFDLREHDEAIVELQTIEELLQNSVNIRGNQVASDLDVKKENLFCRFGLTYEAATQYDTAADYFLRALSVVPTHSDSEAGFVRCIMLSQDSRSAIEKIHLATKQVPHSSRFQIPLAAHHQKLGNYTEAAKVIMRALQSEPNNPEVYVMAASLYLQMGNIGEVEHVLQQAAQRNLQAFELHKIGMQIALQRGDVNSAFRQLELMAQTTTADLSPLKNRIAALAAKLSQS